MTNRFINPRPQFLDTSGKPLKNGKMNFYENGTLIRKDTFADVNQKNKNANPVPLNADGTLPNVFYAGTARVILTFDKGSGEEQRFDLDGVGQFGSGAAFDDFNTLTEYEDGAIVVASDGQIYRSLQNNNQGNDPVASPTFWERIQFIQTYNVNVTYGVDDIAKASNGLIFRSLQANNLNNDPITSPLFWGTPVAFVDVNMIGDLSFAATELTISAGSVAALTSHHTIDTEADAAADNLDTITVAGVADGTMLILRLADAARVVTIKDGTGNIQTKNNADIILDVNIPTVLFRVGTDWFEVQRPVIVVNPFDQSLNTTDSPSFVGLTLDNALPIAEGGTGSITDNAARISLSLSSSIDNVAALILLSLESGQSVETKFYDQRKFKGGGLYLVKTAAEATTDGDTIDEFHNFTLANTNVAVLQHEGVVTAPQFGVFPDGVTNWESTQGARILALFAEMNKGTEIKWTRIGSNNLYFTGLNIFNNKANNWTMSFDEGVEFGNILHIISSDTPVFAEPLSNIDLGVDPTITTTSPHLMVADRFCEFTGTGTNLDTGSFLVSPTGADTATVTATVTGTFVGGTMNDTPIKDVTMKGTYTTYDRWGLINVDGLKADRVVCKSDTSKNTLGLEGGGVHVFTECKNFDVQEVIIEDTQNQASSATMHAAFSADGIGLKNLKFGKIWVKDTKVNGVILQGEGYQIGQIVVDSYGNGVLTSVIPFAGTADLFGVTSATTAHGVWMIRGTGRIDHIVIDQDKGFSGRAFAKKDVMFDRDFLLFDSPQQTSFVDLKTGFSVGHIELRNPQYVGVDFGSYQGWCTPVVDKITFGVIPDDNDAVISDPLRLERGLVNYGFTQSTVGQIRCQDAKEVALAMHNVIYTVESTAAMIRRPSINIGFIECETHFAQLIVMNTAHTIGRIQTWGRGIKDSLFLEPAIVVGSRAKSGNINAINSEAAAAVNAAILKHSGTACKVGAVNTNNFIPNISSDVGVLDFRGFQLKIGSVKIDADVLSTTGVGISYNGCQNSSFDQILVENMGTGVHEGAAGTNANLTCIRCIAIGNTTNSDLPVARLVNNFGNVTWTV